MQTTLQIKVTELTYKVHSICDRSDLIKEQPRRNNGEIPLMYDRLDMFWIEISGKNEYDHTVDCGSVSLDPSLDNPLSYTVAKSWFKGELTQDLVNDLKSWFEKQPEFEQQVQWTKNLIEAGYTRVFAKGVKTEVCDICRSHFLVLDNHRHRKYNGSIYPYDPQASYAGPVEMVD